MKLAKKVLSVVLALAIALGAFAVAASANGNPDTAEYQAKFWLTGSVGTVTWTTNSAVKMTEGDESEPGATIEAQPGDTIFVRLYVTNNYYVHTVQTNLFYSADLIDAAEIYQAQRNRAITVANLKKIHLWNTGNYWVSVQGNSNSAQNAWSLQAEDANYNVGENWPTDEAGNNLFNTSEWKWNRIMNMATEGTGETCIFEEEEHLIKMPLTIPTDAKPGTTYKVTIPEGLEQRSAKKGGKLVLSEIGIADGESEPCDIVDTMAQLTPNMQYGDDNQYFDLSEATLTIVIPGASEPEVNYDELNAKLTEAATALTGNITADSKAALNSAIEVGNAALSSDDQTVVDAAVEALTAAIAAAKDLANFAALNAALSEYAGLNSADWTDASWAAVEAAYATAAAIDQTNEADQTKVDAAANNLAAAIADLAPALVYTALEEAYNANVGKDVANYTDETVARFNAALAVAKNLIDNKNAADQAEIDAAKAELEAAALALAEKDANYEALTAAKDAFTALNAKDWTPDSYNAAKAAYDAACEVAEGLKISQQATIDAAANELNAKITALVRAGAADYDALDKAIADAKALVADHYVDFSGVTAALETAENVARNLNANDQAIIDEAANALVAAMGDLVPADANYDAVNTAVATANAMAVKKSGEALTYTDEYIAALNAAVAEVVYGLEKADQATVDGYAAAINAVIAAPVYRAFDYSKIEAHIAAIEANDADYYNADSYAAYLAAKNDLVWDYTNEQYGQAMLQQSKFLAIAVEVAGPANYDAVEDAIAAYEEKKAAADYTDESIAAVDAEIAKVVYGLNENHQAEVDAYAAAINAAIEKMEEVVIEYADYEEFEAALADADAVDASLYTVKSYAAFEAAVDAAADIAMDLLKADQAIVDNATAAIRAAFDLLKVKANYEALDAAIAEGDGYDPNVWTDETYADLAAAVAAGREVDRDLSADDQAIIDDATEAITDAIAKMERKPVLSSIGAINWTPSEDTHNTFEVVVNGRMAMIQFIEEDGGTRTYDRYNKNVTIKSYNAAGEEVNSLDRSVAYEIWTINTNLIGPEVKARAKYLTGASYVWETETYNFTVETLKPVFDAEVRSITPAATSGKKGAVATTVVVGPDAQGVRFVMDNGTTTTYYADKATVLENGDLEFTGNAWANNAGLNTIIVKVRVNNAWVEAGTVEYTVE